MREREDGYDVNCGANGRRCAPTGQRRWCDSRCRVEQIGLREVRRGVWPDFRADSQVEEVVGGSKEGVELVEGAIKESTYSTPAEVTINIGWT